jgi:hypothetical protein
LAAPCPGRGRGRRGTFRSRARETMPRPAPAPPCCPSLSPGRGRCATQAPPPPWRRCKAGAPGEPPRRLSGAGAPIRPRQPRIASPCAPHAPRGEGRPSGTRSEPARRPVPHLLLRGPGSGPPATVDDPARTRHVRLGAPQLTGTGRAARHYSIADWAPAPQHPSTRRRRSRFGSRTGAGAAGWREARAGCPSAECPPAARRGQARRGSRARRRKGRATMCRGGGGRRRGRLARSRSAAEGAGFRKSKHFGRKSES